MSDPSGDPGARPRPTFGRPGPTNAPSGSSAHPQPTAHQQPPHQQSQAYRQTTAPSGGPFGGPPAAAPETRPRRRGIIPLAIGVVLLLVSLVLGIGGIIWGIASGVGALTGDPTPVAAEGTTIQAESWQMYMVYVPAADADTATCSTEGGAGLVEQPGRDDATISQDGQTYHQVVNLAASQNTEFTLTCEGTSEAIVVGPISMWRMLGPLVGGPIIGGLLGLVGLILLIVGIVKLVRSRRGA
ncbi:MAG: hypothetical protein Q4G40_09565 [Brachybacterium sp.]|nr:hypothetical protein [Brachybacterium sp.]